MEPEQRRPEHNDGGLGGAYPSTLSFARSRSPAWWLAVALGTLAALGHLWSAASAVLAGGDAAPGGWVDVALHVAVYTIVPLAGVIVTVEARGAHRGRVGLLILVATGGFQLATLTFFLTHGLPLSALMGADVAPVFAVAAAVAALLALRANRPWLGGTPAAGSLGRLLAAGGLVALALAAWVPDRGLALPARATVDWPWAAVLTGLALAGLAVALRAIEARDVAAVTGVAAVHAGVAVVTTLRLWLAPPASVAPVPPTALGLTLSVAAAGLLGAAVVRLVRDRR